MHSFLYIFGSKHNVFRMIVLNQYLSYLMKTGLLLGRMITCHLHGTKFNPVVLISSLKVPFILSQEFQLGCKLYDHLRYREKSGLIGEKNMPQERLKQLLKIIEHRRTLVHKSTEASVVHKTKHHKYRTVYETRFIMNNKNT